MTSIEIYPLGAGQEVGRSCIILKILDKRIMMDCGLHMGFSDHRKYPDFKRYATENNIPLFSSVNKYNDVFDLVLITHFHLDHCGALPYFTELCGYDGMILMTTPTRAMLPYMLEDFRKVVSDKEKLDSVTQGKSIFNENANVPIYTYENIKSCLQKISTIQLHESFIHKDIKIKAFYAGHVLGACMFLIEYQGIKVVYTGDFNSSADRHLGPAWIQKCQPDLLISESTYASTLRDSKRSRERDFLKEVQETVDKGGKVLIPVFALGRAQELCILLETYWERAKNAVPIYFAAGLIDKANFYYKLFVNWTNEQIKSTYIQNNMFDFKHIHQFDRNLIKSPNPMVLFATPGMLHGGLSMQVFKEWCNESKNTLIIPGYCVAGTLGNKLLSGEKNIVIDKKNYEINMKVKNMSFSAHADAKGIMQLIKHLEPKNVMLVHGEKSKMEFLSKIIEENMNVTCYFPANFEKCEVKTNKNPNLKNELFFPYEIDFDTNEKRTLSGFVLYNKNSEKYSFINEELFTEEINDLLEMMQSDNYIEEFKLFKGLSVKLEEKYLQNLLSIDKGNNYSNILKDEIKKIFINPNDQQILTQINLYLEQPHVFIEGDYTLIEVKNCMEAIHKYLSSQA